MVELGAKGGVGANEEGEGLAGASQWVVEESSKQKGGGAASIEWSGH